MNENDLPSRRQFHEAAARFRAVFKGDIACTQEMTQFLVSEHYSPELARAITEAICFEADLLLQS